MEGNDYSNAFEKFSEILKDKDIDINNFINTNSQTSEKIGNNENSSENNNGFNIDINTILKFKTIADKLNNSNNPRSSLLQALKPFLSENKQHKLDDYIKIVNIISILEILNKDL